MPLWWLRILRVCLYWSVVAAVAARAQGAEAEAAKPPSFVTVIHKLYDEKLFPACDELMRLAPRDPALTAKDRTDLAGLQLLIASQQPDNDAAKREILQAALLDKGVTLPSSSSLEARARKKLEKMLEEAKASQPPPDESGPALGVLLDAVDALSAQKKYVPFADVVLLQAAKLSGNTEDRACVYIRQGILWAKQDEAKAGTAFQEALKTSADVSSQNCSSGHWDPKALDIFDRAKKEKADKEKAKQKESQFLGNLTPLGRVVSVGVGLGGAAVLAGAGTGAYALHLHELERDAASRGLSAETASNRVAALSWSHVADGLYVSGAITLGLTGLVALVAHPLGFELWSARSEVSLRAGAERGQTSLVIDGRF